MIHWEPLCTNPLTGRRAWAVRSIPSGTYGTAFDWSMVVVRPWGLSRKAIIMLVKRMDVKKRRAIQKTLVEHGFETAEALEHGKWYTWNTKGRKRK